MVGWPSGPRRQFKALVSSEAWVRIPLQSLVPVSLVGQDTRLSPVRPGFKSRTGNIIYAKNLVYLSKKGLGKLHIGFFTLRPPELRWQSGRLLTARSSVRSRVEANYFFEIDKKKECASTQDRTEDLAVNSRPLCQRSSGGLTSVLSMLTSPHSSTTFGPKNKRIPRPGFEPGSHG